MWTGGQKYEDDFIPTTHLWIYHPEQNTFEMKKLSGDIPKLRQFAAAGVIGDNVFLFGGTSEGSKHLNDIHALDLKSMKCQELRPIHNPSPRRNMSSWVWNATFYVWRGWVEDYSNPEYISQHGIVQDDGRQREGRTDQLVAFVDGDWTAVETSGPKPSPGNCAVSPISWDGRVFTIGGHQVSEPHKLFQLDMKTLKWSVLREFSGVSSLSFIREVALLGPRIIIPVGHVNDNGIYVINMETWCYERVAEHPPHYQRAPGGQGMTDATVTYVEELNKVIVFGGVDDVDLVSTTFPSKYSAKNKLSRHVIHLDVLQLFTQQQQQQHQHQNQHQQQQEQ